MGRQVTLEDVAAEAIGAKIYRMSGSAPFRVPEPLPMTRGRATQVGLTSSSSH